MTRASVYPCLIVCGVWSLFALLSKEEAKSTAGHRSTACVLYHASTQRRRPSNERRSFATKAECWHCCIREQSDSAFFLIGAADLDIVKAADEV